MADPPSSDGVDHDRCAVVPFAKPERLRGALGAEKPLTVAVNTDDGALSPTEFTAMTRNMCSRPPARPLKDCRNAPVTKVPRVHVTPRSSDHSTK